MVQIKCQLFNSLSIISFHQTCESLVICFFNTDKRKLIPFIQQQLMILFSVFLWAKN